MHFPWRNELPAFHRPSQSTSSSVCLLDVSTRPISLFCHISHCSLGIYAIVHWFNYQLVSQTHGSFSFNRIHFPAWAQFYRLVEIVEIVMVISATYILTIHLLVYYLAKIYLALQMFCVLLITKFLSESKLVFWKWVTTSPVSVFTKPIQL